MDLDRFGVLCLAALTLFPWISRWHVATAVVPVMILCMLIDVQQCRCSYRAKNSGTWIQAVAALLHRMRHDSYHRCLSFFFRVETQNKHVGALQQAIITAIRARLRGTEHRLKKPCLGVGWARDMQSLLGYSFGKTRDYLQIYLAMPSLLPRVSRCGFCCVQKSFFSMCCLQHAPRASMHERYFFLIQLSMLRVLPEI